MPRLFCLFCSSHLCWRLHNTDSFVLLGRWIFLNAQLIPWPVKMELMWVCSTQWRTHQGWSNFSALCNRKQEHAWEAFLEKPFWKASCYLQCFGSLGWTCLVMQSVVCICETRLVLIQRFAVFHGALIYSLGFIHKISIYRIIGSLCL